MNAWECKVAPSKDKISGLKHKALIVGELRLGCNRRLGEKQVLKVCLKIGAWPPASSVNSQASCAAMRGSDSSGLQFCRKHSMAIET